MFQVSRLPLSTETRSCSQAWSQNTQKGDIFRQAHLESDRLPQRSWRPRSEGVGGMQPCLLGSSVVSLGAPRGWRRSVAGQAPSLDDTGASLAVEQLLCGLCPKHSPRWEPLLVYPCPWSVQGLGSMCTRVPAVLGVHTCACCLGRTHGCLQSWVCTWVPAVWECTWVPAILSVHMGAPVCDGLPSPGLVACSAWRR